MVRTWQEPLKVGVVKVYNTLLSVTVMAPVVMVTNISQVAAVAISLRVGYLQHNHRRLELIQEAVVQAQVQVAEVVLQVILVVAVVVL